MSKYIFLLLLLLSTGAWATPSRYALVIGNAAYPKARLDNPVNDANDMAAKLKQRGFTVTRLVDANQQRMEKAIKSFTDKLNASGTVGVFYYAGHGLEVEGANYLVPVDADLPDEEDVKYKTVNVGQVLDRMNKASNGLNLVILDACRNNPFKRRGLKRVSGLASMQPAAGTLVLYATEPHKEAEDGKGRNGTFTKHLLAALDMPGIQVEEAFKQVSERVTDETNKQQIPWLEGIIHGRFYFVSPPDKPIPPQANMEQTYWQSTEKCGTSKCFKAYLKKYPQGEFVELAEAQLVDYAPIPAPLQPSNEYYNQKSVNGLLPGIKATNLIGGRYQDNGNGTVTDITTKLMWKRCAEGQNWDGGTCTGTASQMGWDAAMPDEKQKFWTAFADYDDWKVPTIEQLRTLVYCSSGDPKTWNYNNTEYFKCQGAYKTPTIDTTAFPNATGKYQWFWSASAVASGSTNAWLLYFDIGNDYGNSRSNARQVRLVRGGQ